MMNLKDFKQYLADNVKAFLPESFADASVSFDEVMKNNDTVLTGLAIRKPSQSIVPNIYVEDFYKEYQRGINLPSIASHIAAIRLEHEDIIQSGQFRTDDIYAKLMDYSSMKNNLFISLCDTQTNKERLKNMVHTEHGDFSATYHIAIDNFIGPNASTAVTEHLLQEWGISLEQLHQDALAADLLKEPMLCDMVDLINSMNFGLKPQNLLNASVIEPLEMNVEMYCLTNASNLNAAALVLQDNIMEKIGDMIGTNYYVLPSSTHEVMIVKDSGNIDLTELSVMVKDINETQVAATDRLSDKVQYYDRETHVLENAKQRSTRLEMESKGKQEKNKGKSIHERLSEKKETSKKQTRSKPEKTKEAQFSI